MSACAARGRNAGERFGTRLQNGGVGEDVGTDVAQLVKTFGRQVLDARHHGVLQTLAMRHGQPDVESLLSRLRGHVGPCFVERGQRDVVAL